MDGWMDFLLIISQQEFFREYFQKIVRTLLNVKKILLRVGYRDYFFTNLSLRIKLENFE